MSRNQPPGGQPTIVCWNCQQINPYGAMTCSRCNAQFSYQPQPPSAYPAPPPKVVVVRQGWGCGKLFLAILGVLIVLGALGAAFRPNGFTPSTSGSSSTSKSNTTSNQSAPSNRKSISLSGDGIKKTESFHLSGDYLISWTGKDKGSSSVGCYHGLHLLRKDGSFSGSELFANEVIDAGKQVSRSTNVYGLPDADYYVDATSSCSWTVKIDPK